MRQLVRIGALVGLLGSLFSVVNAQREPELDCVTPDSSVTLNDPTAFSDPYNSQARLDFLNAGGMPDALESFMESQQVTAPNGDLLPYVWDIQVAALEPGESPALFVAVTVPQDDSSGESYFLAYWCDEGEYQESTVFRRVGDSTENAGLYAGGGTEILTIEDLNGNDLVDVLFTVSWAVEGETPVVQFHLVEWGGDDWLSLWQQSDEFGTPRNYITGEDADDIELEEVGDGRYLIQIAGAEYQWDGEQFTSAG
jgi:hypothetical protein